MVVTKKRANLATLNILKSIVDNRARKLQATVDAGNRAAQEEVEICAHISALQQFIIGSRYDPADAREAEQELEDYEAQSAAIHAKVAQGKLAAAQMADVAKFNETYRAALSDAINGRKLKFLIESRNEIENRLAHLDKCIEACEINVAPRTYGSDVVSQSTDELAAYSQEYDLLSERLHTINAQIHQIKSK